jgi:protease secretion system outer membrane protein
MVFKRSALALAAAVSVIAAPLSHGAEKSTPIVSASFQAKPLSLIEAYEAALVHDPLYRAAIQERIAGSQYAVIGRAALLPQVAYSNSRSKNFNVNTQQTTLGERLEDVNYVSKSDSISLRQPLFSLEALARFLQGRAQSQASELQFAVKAKDLLTRVTDAYANLLLALGQRDVINAQLDSLIEQEAVNRRLYEGGEGTITDVLEVSSRLNLTRSQRIEVEDAVDFARRSLMLLVGESQSARVGAIQHNLSRALNVSDLVGVMQGKGSVTDFEAWKAMALTNSPDLAAAQKMVEVAEREVQKALAQHAPTVTGSIGYGNSSSESILLVNRNYLNRSIGVSLSVPLYSGGATQAAVVQARANLERAKADLDGRTEKLLVELKRQHNSIVSGLKKLEALQMAEATGIALIKATEESVKGGVRIPFNVLQAKAQLTQTRLDIMKGRLQVLLADAKLRAFAGVLQAEDLERVGRVM